MTVVPIYTEPEEEQQQTEWTSSGLTRTNRIVVITFGIVAALVIFGLFMYVPRLFTNGIADHCLRTYVLRQRRRGQTFSSWVTENAPCLRRKPKTQGQTYKQRKLEDPEKVVEGIRTVWGDEVW